MIVGEGEGWFVFFCTLDKTRAKIGIGFRFGFVADNREEMVHLTCHGIHKRGREAVLGVFFFKGRGVI